MDFKNILSQLSHLSEATEEANDRKIHKADPGGYGRKFDTDEEGDEKKPAKPAAPKRGRGRPKKDSDETGEKKTYDTKTLGNVFGGGKKPKKEVGKTSVKHSLKEWVEEIEQKYVLEGIPPGMKPLAILDPKNQQAGAGVVTSKNPAVQKMLGGLDPNDVQIVMTTQQGSTQAPAPGGATGQAPAGQQQVKEKWAGDAKVHSTGEFSKKSVDELKSMLAKLKKSGPHPENSPEAKKQRQINFALRAKGGWKKGEGAAQKESVYEGDIPSDQQDMGAGLGAGRNQQALEENQMKHSFVILDDSLLDQISTMSGAEVDPDAGTVETWNENTARQLIAFAQKNPTRLKRAQSMNTAGMRPMAQFTGGTASGPEYNLKEGKKKNLPSDQEKIDVANPKGKIDSKDFAKLRSKKQIDEGMIDKLKGMVVPKLIKMLGAEQSSQIANAVKQVTGGDFTPSKENAIKVAQALGFDKMANPDQAKAMSEGIAGDWKGKLIQLLYTLGLLGAGAGASAMWGTVGGSFMGVIGVLLLMFANTFFGEAPGQVGAMGKDDRKKVDESMNTKLKAAHLRGKSHAMAKEGYNCRYDDIEEARMYHEGYKEGLDECYGQVPIRGTVVDEMDVPATVPGMADQAEGLDEMDMYEMDKTEYMKHKAQTTPGGTFKAFGQTMHDKDVLETSMFESWDKELNNLLTEYDTIQEGLTVSISKGQQGAPDSVSVTAQDQEADQLLSIIKSAGLGLFGAEGSQGAQDGQSSPMSLQPADGEHEGDIDVVDDHDGMMALIKKVTGGAGEPNTVAIGTGDHGDDYEDEEKHDHDHADESTCNECGMTESDCECEPGKEVVDEVESEDQMAYEVAEDNPPDSGAEETAQEDEDVAQANASAADSGGAPDLEEDEESEKLDEWANEAGQRGTDAAFEADIAFMTKVIAGGLNKEKSTGQTTVPVIAGQTNRMGVNESINDWKKLAGLK